MNTSLNVKIGINPISWSNDDLPSLGGEIPLEVALSEGAAIGFKGFELGNKFPRESKALNAVLKPYNLECVSGWYSGRLASRSVKEEIAEVESHLTLLAESHSPVMVYGEVQDAIQGLPISLYKRPQFATSDAWKIYGEKLTQFGAHLKTRGVHLAYHHHMGAYVQSAQDIDVLMKSTGIECGLLFDSGHVTFGGGDALAVLKKHISRVVHVHCKDVRPQVMKLAYNRQWSFLESVINGVFTVPGDGCVDFKSIISTLAHHNYLGWLVVEAEQDPAVAPSEKFARKGYEHLNQLVQAVQRA